MRHGALRRLLEAGVIAALAATGALAGCTVLAPRYAPGAPPSAAGLVIVYGDMTMPLVRWGRVFAGGAKEDVRPLDYGRIGIEGGPSVQGRGLGGGAVAFSAPSGRYRVRTLGYVQRRSAGPYPMDFEPPAAAFEQYPALMFEVRAGEIVLVGKVRIQYRDASLQEDFALERYTVTPDPRAERAALSAVLAELDPASPWRPLVAQRLAAAGQ